ncbi:MAG: hypothetical protein K9L64_03820 [Candidatus Izimaplasma sp.]|nr:hypothetical protein [Candidatus Izimaplasma bacterium]
MTKNNTSDDIIKRYKKSIIFDSFICMFPEIIFGILFPYLKNVFHNSILLVFFLIGTISIVIYLFLDIVFLGRSPGMRLYKLAIYKKEQNKKVELFKYIHRRFLELTIHSFFTKSFDSKCNYIDKITNTYIDCNF